MSDDEGTFEERELLLASSESALSRTDKVPASSAPPPPETTDATHATPSGWQAPEPLVHFHSLSVNLRRAGDSEFAGGSARIVETDRGGPDDFCSIDVDINWTPRGAGVPRPDAVPTTTTSNSESDEPAATESTSLVSHTVSVETVSAESAVEFRLALDDVLTIRLTDVPGARPTVAIQRRGGAPWGTLEFANGPDVLRAFLKALSRHSKRFPIADAYLPGALLCVETQPRMRRAARSLSDHDEPFAEDIGASGDAFVRPIPPVRGGGARALQEQGMSVLEQFARVTQLSREVGESLSLVFNDRKRRELVERRRREQAARQRAMDINAEIVASSQDERALPPRLTLERARGAPVSRAIWIAAMDGAGRLRDPAAMRQAVFSGGVEPDLRRDVWPVLLGVFPWDSTRAQRAQILEEKRALFADMRAKWEKVRGSAHAAEAESMARGGARLSREERVGAKLGDYLQSEEQIEKDIMRTDRLVELYEADDSEASRVMGDILNIYAEHDKKIRYCQGMSDFLSQILYHIGVEHQALVFWCFEGLMQRCECNFRIDQTGIHSQLGRLRKLVQKAEPGLAAFFKETDAEYYTCFRWILVRLKRELPYHATARLWEVLWTRHVGADSLHLYLAVGLLSAHKQRIMALPTGEFDSLLRYINDMSGRIDVDFALREAELWYRKLGPISD